MNIFLSIKDNMIRSIIFILCFVTLQVHAQSESYGFKIGTSIVNLRSTLNGQPIANAYNWRISYLAGFTYRYDVDENFAIKVDVLYAQKGTKYGRLSQFGNINYHLHYLDVPAVASYKMDDKIDVHLGVELGYLVASNFSIEGFSTTVGTSFNSFELNPVIGLGYLFDNGMFIDARYTFGIIDIDSPIDSQSGTTNVKTINQAFQFSLGYYLSKNDL